MKYIHSSESNYLFTLECPAGYYGNDCRYHCSLNCDVTSICDKSSGQCEGGCKPGWTGATCDQCECLTILSKRRWIMFTCTVFSGVIENKKLKKDNVKFKIEWIKKDIGFLEIDMGLKKCYLVKISYLKLVLYNELHGLQESWSNNDYMWSVNSIPGSSFADH